MADRYFKHKKTGNIYRLLDKGTSCTNGDEGAEYAIYRDADSDYHDGSETFVRKWSEFIEKFEEV